MKKVLTLFLVFTLGLTLASCTNEEDVANVQDAAQKLSIDVTDPMKVTDNLVLPTEGLHESTITWESDNTDVIANDGTVTRPEIGADDVTVVLTATLKVGKETYEKEFTFKVLAAVPSAAITIAELESSEYADDDVVEITGIVTGIVRTYGYHVQDSTGGTFVYIDGTPEDVAIGDEVTITGVKDTYFGVVQVSGVTKTVVNSSDNAIPAHEATSISDLYDLNPDGNTVYNDLISFDAYAVIYGKYDGVYLAWYDGNLNLDKLEVYYKSGLLASDATNDDSPSVAALRALAGKKVNAQAVFKDNYKGVFRVTVDTPSTFTEKTMTDQEKAYLAVAFETDYIQAQGTKLYNDLELGATSAYVDGVALTWESNNTAALANDGTATHVIGSEPVVELKVTATINDATATKTYLITLVDKVKLDGMSVEDALALDDGTLAVVTGVVSAVRDNGKPFIQDENGNGIYIYESLDVNVGDEIKVKGTIDTFDSYGNNMKQLSSGTLLVEVLSTGNDLVIDTTTTLAELMAAMNTYHSQLFTMTLVLEGTNYGNFNFTGDGTNLVVFEEDYFPTLADYVDATTSEITITFVMRDISYDDARIVPVDFPDLTNAEKLALVEDYIDVAGTYSSDLSLITQVPWFDATITWTSTNTAVDPLTGEITRPANGDGNATGDLVAAVVIGDDDAVDKTYAVVVKEELPPSTPDLMFSEYIEGGSYNKAFELYNPTDAAIDLSNYVINLYINGATEPSKTLTLSGTLAAGEVYVVCNSGVTDDSVCDLIDNNITGFNGDDVLEITKNGDVVDMFGVIGTDSDFAKDHTYRRKAAINKPNRVYDASEWDEFNKDDNTGLGTHTHTAS